MSTIIYENRYPKEIYIGELVEKRRTGYGIHLNLETQQQYFGELKNGTYSGVGKITFEKTERIGSFENNLLNGTGKITNDGVVVYIGEFKNDEIEGIGCFIDESTNTKLFGNLQNKVLNGFGYTMKDNIMLYIGTFTNGTLHGIGTFYTSQSHHTGQFSFGVALGVGLTKYTNGEIKMGIWRNGILDQFGREESNDKEITYEGEYKSGIRFGLCRLSWDFGKCIYIGNVENGKPRGFGKLDTPEYIYVGNWENGRRHSLGYQISKNQDDIYYGQWMLGVKHGKGISIEKGVHSKGTWVEGRKHGRFFVTIQNQESIHVEFLNDTLIRYVSVDEEYLALEIPDLNFEKFLEDNKDKIKNITLFLQSKSQEIFDIVRDIKHKIDLAKQDLTQHLNSQDSHISTISSRLSTAYDNLSCSTESHGFTLQSLLSSTSPFSAELLPLSISGSSPVLLNSPVQLSRLIKWESTQITSLSSSLAALSTPPLLAVSKAQQSVSSVFDFDGRAALLRERENRVQTAKTGIEQRIQDRAKKERENEVLENECKARLEALAEAVRGFAEREEMYNNSVQKEGRKIWSDLKVIQANLDGFEPKLRKKIGEQFARKLEEVNIESRDPNDIISLLDVRDKQILTSISELELKNLRTQEKIESIKLELSKIEKNITNEKQNKIQLEVSIKEAEKRIAKMDIKSSENMKTLELHQKKLLIVEEHISLQKEELNQLTVQLEEKETIRKNKYDDYNKRQSILGTTFDVMGAQFEKALEIINSVQASSDSLIMKAKESNAIHTEEIEVNHPQITQNIAFVSNRNKSDMLVYEGEIDDSSEINNERYLYSETESKLINQDSSKFNSTRELEKLIEPAEQDIKLASLDKDPTEVNEQSGSIEVKELSEKDIYLPNLNRDYLEDKEPVEQDIAPANLDQNLADVKERNKEHDNIAVFDQGTIGVGKNQQSQKQQLNNEAEQAEVFPLVALNLDSEPKQQISKVQHQVDNEMQFEIKRLMETLLQNDKVIEKQRNLITDQTTENQQLQLQQKLLISTSITNLLSGHPMHTRGTINELERTLTASKKELQECQLEMETKKRQLSKIEAEILSLERTKTLALQKIEEFKRALSKQQKEDEEARNLQLIQQKLELLKQKRAKEEEERAMQVAEFEERKKQANEQLQASIASLKKIRAVYESKVARKEEIKAKAEGEKQAKIKEQERMKIESQEIATQKIASLKKKRDELKAKLEEINNTSELQTEIVQIDNNENEFANDEHDEEDNRVQYNSAQVKERLSQCTQFKEIESPTAISNLDISHDLKYLYVLTLDKILKYRCKKTIPLLKEYERYRETKYIKCCKNGNLLIHHGKTNIVSFTNPKMKEVRDPLSGMKDTPREIYHYNVSVCGSGTQYLWYKGMHDLDILNLDTFETKAIHNFWKKEDINRQINPFFALTNKKGTKVFGIGDDDIIQNHLAIYWDSNQTKVIKDIDKDYQIMSKWVSYETSFNEKFIYIGGTKNIDAAILIIRFEESLKIAGFRHFTEGDYKSISALRRADGTDILMAGAFQTILLLEPSKASNGSKLKLIRAIPWPCEAEIRWIGINQEHLFTLDTTRRIIIVGKYAVQLNLAGMKIAEYGQGQEDENKQNNEIN